MTLPEGMVSALLPRLLAGAGVFAGCFLFLLVLALLGCLLLCRKRN